MPWTVAPGAFARGLGMFCVRLASSAASLSHNCCRYGKRTFSAFASMLIGIILAIGLPVYGQAPPGLPPGLPPFATFSSGNFGTVNLANLNIHFEIPLRSLPGREFPLSLSLINDVSFGTPAQDSNGVIYWRSSAANYTTANPRAGNWNGSGFLPGQVQFDTNSKQCNYQGVSSPYTTYTNFRYLDTHGTLHYFPSNLSVDAGTCLSSPYDDDGGQVGAVDGSPYTLHITEGAGAPNAYVVDDAGTIDEAIDRNGNTNTNTFYGGQSGSITDSSGNAAMSVTGTSNSETFSYVGPDGKTVNIVATLSSIPAAGTGPGCPHIPDSSNNSYPETVLSNLAFPDGTSYSFTYDSMGRPLNITLPTGGTISYSYNPANSGISCVDGGFSSLTKTTPDGTWSYSRSYNPTTWLWTTTVIDPLLNQTIYTFGGAPFSAFSLGSGASSAEYETQRQIYQKVNGTQVLQKTIVTCYNGNFTNCATDPNPSIYTTSAGYALPIAPVQKDVYTYLPGISGPSLSETTFDGELLSEDKEYDFGAAIPPGSNFISDRKLTYWTCGGSGKPCTDITKDSSGTTLASATYQYDSAGNELSESHLAQGTTYVTTTHSYTANGMVNKTTYPNGAFTTYTYACNGAFPTTSTTGSMSTTTQWDCVGEVPTSITDPNNNVTNFKYVNSSGTGDPFWRLVQTNYPDGGQLTNTYNDPGLTISATTLENAGTSLTSTQSFDGLGRPLVSTSASGAITKTAYNSLGLIASITNPYFSTSDPTYGITSFTYDALGRKRYQCQPDNGTGSGPCVPGASYQQWTYSGNLTTFSDEVHNQWNRTSDALGRLTSVVELGGLQTSYSYSGVGNLLCVDQWGTGSIGQPCTSTHKRSFVYDSLSRLTSSTNPETGTVGYTYYPSGNVQSKTDARGVITTYSYDSLNRLISKTYQNAPAGSLSSCFQYDTSPGGIGRLAEEWTQAGTCPSTAPTNNAPTMKRILAYDSMGRVLKEQQCHLNNCKVNIPPYSINSSFDLAGNLTSYTNNINSITLGTSYDPAGRLKSISSSLFDAQHPAELFSVGAYTPTGAIQSMTLGSELNVTTTYDRRLRPSGETAAHQ